MTRLHIINYKNIENIDIEPHAQLNAFVGMNGMGKTNSLDAVHYLCLTKSAFTRIERNNVLSGQDYFRLRGNFKNEMFSTEIVAKLRIPNQKIIEQDKVEIEKISEFIGKIPVVIITPDNKSELIESSVERRNFMNKALSQTDKKYLEALMQYNRILNQRNAYLKNNHADNVDSILMEAYDKKIAPLAKIIFEKRFEFVTKINVLFDEIYKNIASSNEIFKIEYESQLQDADYRELVKSNFKKDILQKRSNIGIHRDDLIFKMNGNLLRHFGSQGQIKTFFLGIKLSEYLYLKEIKGTKPILILDDIFDKLDKSRLQKLISLLSNDYFGQVFISDTDKERINKIFLASGSDYKIFEIENGSIFNEYGK
ncbi:MAG: DNA replication and repair protein RecF [Saprospiraceae bacterium]